MVSLERYHCKIWKRQQFGGGIAPDTRARLVWLDGDDEILGDSRHTEAVQVRANYIVAGCMCARKPFISACQLSERMYCTRQPCTQLLTYVRLCHPRRL